MTRLFHTDLIFFYLEKIFYLPPFSISESLGNSETMSSDKRRHIHNLCEKKRRENIKEAFVCLHQRLPKRQFVKSQLSSSFNKSYINSNNASQPTFRFSKMSKMEILKKAIEIISSLKMTTEMLENEVTYLENVALTQQQETLHLLKSLSNSFNTTENNQEIKNSIS